MAVLHAYSYTSRRAPFEYWLANKNTDTPARTKTRTFASKLSIFTAKINELYEAGTIARLLASA
jgi:hypothetical protein